ncbi:MAG: DAK2 domain-containing protein, partial [Coriobacteriaceae bacterium]|nr:DAK2 domain-containing protein [Coriobacteriaceae bacterium]
PNNKNIIMAAKTCAELSEIPCGVVPSRSVPQAFSAMFEADPEASMEENVEAMSSVLGDVRTGEVTTAIKDSKDAHGNPIADGDVIGIADGSIEAVGSTVEDVVLALLENMDADDADTLTLLAGADYDDERFEALQERIEEAFDGIEIDAHRGEQPLYPIVLSVE